MLDESEFLSDYGVRSMSRYHLDHPLPPQGGRHRPVGALHAGESDSRQFGGNSNWRGPIWFPMNFLIIDRCRSFIHYYGDDFKVECPTGSGHFYTIEEVATELSRRLSSIFLKDAAGERAVLRHQPALQTDPHYRDCIPFYEFFHGDSGRGGGAAHQTGWTALIAKLLMPRAHDRDGLLSALDVLPRRGTVNVPGSAALAPAHRHPTLRESGLHAQSRARPVHRRAHPGVSDRNAPGPHSSTTWGATIERLRLRNCANATSNPSGPCSSPRKCPRNSGFRGIWSGSAFAQGHRCGVPRPSATGTMREGCATCRVAKVHVHRDGTGCGRIPTRRRSLCRRSRRHRGVAAAERRIHGGNRRAPPSPPPVTPPATSPCSSNYPRVRPSFSAGMRPIFARTSPTKSPPGSAGRTTKLWRSRASASSTPWRDPSTPSCGRTTTSRAIAAAGVSAVAQLSVLPGSGGPIRSQEETTPG